MSKQSYSLYEINRNVKCLSCGHKGAIQVFGDWYSKGLGEKVNGIISFEKYRDQPFMSHAVGFGGTISWEYTNCGNIGLIDFSDLEGYEKAFETIGSDTIEQ